MFNFIKKLFRLQKKNEEISLPLPPPPPDAFDQLPKVNPEKLSKLNVTTTTFDGVNRKEKEEDPLIDGITENEAPVPQELTMKDKMKVYFMNLEKDENIVKIDALKRKSKKSWDYFQIYPYEVQSFKNRKKELAL